MALKLSDLQGQYEEIEKPKTGLGAGVGTFVKGLGVGALKSLGETALGVGQLGRKIQSGIAGAVGAESALGGEGMFDPAQAQQIRETTLAANAPGQGTGKFIGTAAQYLLPTSKITRAQNILGAAASQLPKTGGLQLAGKAASRFIPEAIGTGAVAGVRSGGDLEQTKNEALMAGGFSVGLGALGALARSSYWPILDDSVNKALGTQGKKSGGVALQETAKKVSGLKVLKERAPQLTVTLEDGAKVAFDPQNASYGTTLQAWNQARNQVFNEYTSLAQKAGEKSTLDLSTVRQQIAEALDAPILSIEKNAVRSILSDFDSIFKDPAKVDMQAAERFVKSLNDNTVQGFFSGTSDAASSKVNAGTAKLIRDILDETIEDTTGAQYQNLRSQYSALKSLENDLVRKFQQDARSIGGGLPEYTGAFASGDIIGSALSLDPAQFAKGATLGTFSVLKRKLSNPERFLRRSFDLIDDTPTDLTTRLFGGSKPLTKEEQEMANSVAKSVKEPNIGLSIKDVSKDPSFNQGATPSTNLLEEARGKTLDEFVKAKTEPSDYGYSHRPTEGPRAFNLTEKVDGEQMIPSDMYSQWYGSRGTPEDIESINALKKIKGNPEAEVIIYRASPKSDFNYGDWVTLSKKYAQQHAESNGDKTFKVNEMKVKAKDIRWAMDDVNEFGYYPEDYKSQLQDIWKQANKPSSLLEEAKKYKSVELNYVYNTKKANLGNQDFAQDVEPAGRYMNVGFDEFPGGEGMKTGKITFKNPLVLEWKTSRTGGWKTDLSEMYGGKTGKELSQAIIDDGYDGIIAVTGDNPREAVNLQEFIK